MLINPNPSANSLEKRKRMRTRQMGFSKILLKESVLGSAPLFYGLGAPIRWRYQKLRRKDLSQIAGLDLTKPTLRIIIPNRKFLD